MDCGDEPFAFILDERNEAGAALLVALKRDTLTQDRQSINVTVRSNDVPEGPVHEVLVASAEGGGFRLNDGMRKSLASGTLQARG